MVTKAPNVRAAINCARALGLLDDALKIYLTIVAVVAFFAILNAYFLCHQLIYQSENFVGRGNFSYTGRGNFLTIGWGNSSRRAIRLTHKHKRNKRNRINKERERATKDREPNGREPGDSNVFRFTTPVCSSGFGRALLSPG
jgi:hypothetical protein